MRLAISNIAWDVQEDLAVANLLRTFAVDAIDVAPGKYFPEPKSAKDSNIKKVKDWWADQGIEITGMQALLFGTTGLNMFSDNKIQQAMLEHLRAVCRIGKGLGATRLVFGSPKNRDRSGFNDSRVLEEAVKFFLCLGDIAEENGVVICLEPNPAQYGANFMMNSIDTANVVTHVAHNAIRMQFDTGAITINNEKPDTILDHFSGLIGHVHASEPSLVPLGDGVTDHQMMHKALYNHLPNHVVSIEMLATKEEFFLQSIGRALKFATEWYRPNEDEHK